MHAYISHVEHPPHVQVVAIAEEVHALLDGRRPRPVLVEAHESDEHTEPLPFIEACWSIYIYIYLS